ncbi:hypothetical protein [Intrasporangium sp. DVR]|uniref:hypothetical protein n=1 Tax=Intrasporangium sp. DVR TaxID=3127867 RepID=UPI00313A6D0C
MTPRRPSTATAQDPTVTPARVAPNPDYPGAVLLWVECPHCGRTHLHGNLIASQPTGHRMAYCNRGGYHIGEPGPETVIDP